MNHLDDLETRGMVDSKVVHGDCLAVMRGMADACVDSIVTDPPYHLTQNSRGGSPRTNDPETPFGRHRLADKGFMGQTWDGGDIAFRVELWAEALRVLKPGGHLLAFSGSRTYHRMVCAIEDAGFEIRDQIFWVYGSGFPKSLNVSVAIDRAAGAEREVVGRTEHPDGRPRNLVSRDRGVHEGGQRLNGVGLDITAPATPEAQQWAGWGTALKPSHEPVVVARKPLIGTVAQNVLAHGTGALNIDACRVAAAIGDAPLNWERPRGMGYHCGTDTGPCAASPNAAGRWPANVLHDGSDEVLEAFAAQGRRAGVHGPGHARDVVRGGEYDASSYDLGGPRRMHRFDDSATDQSSPARFFYSAKASKADRAGSRHPTVKPISLMRYLVKLVTPPGGTVLDPFAGSGTTLQAAVEEGFRAIGIEQSEEYVGDIRRRLERAGKAAEEPAPRPKAIRAARRKPPAPGAWPTLFDLMVAP